VKNRAPLSRKLKDGIVIIITGMLLGLLYPIMSGELGKIPEMVNGFLIGLLGTIFIVVNEIWINKSIIRQMKFMPILIYKSILYSVFFTILIILEISTQRAISAKTSLIGFMRSDDFSVLFHEDLVTIIIYALVLTVSFILVYQISKKMGQGVLWSFIIGRYHHAREEERIFMFMDLNNSTELAEKLGDIEFNNLLKDFFFDITDSIITNYGIIYRYVGDEVVVSWKLKKGLPHAHFLRTFFDAKRAIHLKREKYLESYGLVPHFTAGVSYGNIVVGELGEVKSQICFFGKVMTETPALEKACKKYDTDIIISEALLKLVELPIIFTAKKEGEIEFPGLESAPVTAFSIKEK
jgi:adenylate cyclase